ncbi:MAG: hypothetical protein JWM36_2754 [Hyphomicrobiales bacterium]|nr:hypothetical protein [Hyphomicrobiales bacterium]
MVLTRSLCACCALAITAALPRPAAAHATLEQQRAAVGSFYKAVVRVPHGCEGQPTLRVRVQVPEGVLAVKPMLKPGWELAVVKKPYGQPYQYHGATLTEGIREVAWTGKLPDENYDEFVFQAFLSDTLKPDTVLYFPVVQECEKGAERWIEVPTEGKSSRDYRFPAPGVRLVRPSSD